MPQSNVEVFPRHTKEQENTHINDVRTRSFGLGIWVLIASVPDLCILFTFDKKMVRDAVIFEISHITKHSISKQR